MRVGETDLAKEMIALHAQGVAPELSVAYAALARPVRRVLEDLSPFRERGCREKAANLAFAVAYRAGDHWLHGSSDFLTMHTLLLPGAVVRKHHSRQVNLQIHTRLRNVRPHSGPSSFDGYCGSCGKWGHRSRDCYWGKGSRIYHLKDAPTRDNAYPATLTAQSSTQQP